MRSDGRDRNRCARNTCAEARLWPEVVAYAPLLGGHPAVLVQMDDDFLSGLDRNVAARDRISLVGHGTGPRVNAQALVPNPVHIEFVHMADEICRRRAVREDGSPRIALKFQIGKRSGDFLSTGLKRNIQLAFSPALTVTSWICGTYA
jgi:hypothetical protein